MSEPNQKAAATKEKSTTAPKASKAKNIRPRASRGGAGRQRSNKPVPNQQSGKKRTYPTMQVSLEIDHAIVRGAFDAHFDGFRSAFFHTTSILGKFGMEDGASQVHEYIVGVIDNVKAEVDRASAVIIKKIVKAGGSENIPRTAPTPDKCTAEVPAFVVRKYLSLFPAVDRLVDAIVCAESLGAVSWTERMKMLKAAPSYLRSPAGRFTSISTKLSARQRGSQKDLNKAKKAMEEVLASVLADHAGLKGVEEKRPLTKTGTDA